MADTFLTIRLDESTLAKLKELAEGQRRKTAALARILIEDFVEQQSPAKKSRAVATTSK